MLQTPFTWFGNPKRCCRWQLVDIKPCHLIRKSLFDRKKSWLQGTTRRLWTIWMRRSAITGKWISFLKESCSFCVLHWFSLVNKICLSISFQGSPAGLSRLVRGFHKKPRESDEEARRRFYRRIFGILWVYFNFNLIVLSDLIKKYCSFQVTSYERLSPRRMPCKPAHWCTGKFHVHALK